MAAPLPLASPFGAPPFAPPLTNLVPPPLANRVAPPLRRSLSPPPLSPPPLSPPPLGALDPTLGPTLGASLGASLGATFGAILALRRDLVIRDTEREWRAERAQVAERLPALERRGGRVGGLGCRRRRSRRVQWRCRRTSIRFSRRFRRWCTAGCPLMSALELGEEVDGDDAAEAAREHAEGHRAAAHRRERAQALAERRLELGVGWGGGVGGGG